MPCVLCSENLLTTAFRLNASRDEHGATNAARRLQAEPLAVLSRVLRNDEKEEPLEYQQRDFFLSSTHSRSFIATASGSLSVRRASRRCDAHLGVTKDRQVAKRST